MDLRVYSAISFPYSVREYVNINVKQLTWDPTAIQRGQCRTRSNAHKGTDRVSWREPLVSHKAKACLWEMGRQRQMEKTRGSRCEGDEKWMKRKSTSRALFRSPLGFYSFSRSPRSLVLIAVGIHKCKSTLGGAVILVASRHSWIGYPSN